MSDIRVKDTIRVKYTFSQSLFPCEEYSMNNIERFWDKRAKEYDRNEEKYRKMYDMAINFTMQHLKSSDIALDYGCGTGVITNEIAACVKEMHGIDISSKSIDVAMKRAAENNVTNIIYQHADIFDEKYTPESFDVVLSFSVLHLIEEPDDVIRRIHELLVPGGLLISATPCLGEGGSPLSTILYLLSKTRLVPYIVKYKSDELASLIAKIKFEIVRTEIIRSITINSFIVARKV
jgi:2-polyprenyl-3-methyl-5-hydroxy-6-metoxy-1,4-benzoquinol methylase